MSPTQRPVRWFLPVPGTVQYIVVDEPERDPQVQSRFGEVLEQRRRERAVAIGTVRRSRPGLCGKGDQGVGGVRFDSRQAPANGARGQSALHRPCERIVAAGVQNDEPQPLCRFNHLEDAFERKRFVFNVDVTLSFVGRINS